MRTYVQFEDSQTNTTESVEYGSLLSRHDNISSYSLLPLYQPDLSSFMEASVAISRRLAILEWDVAVSASEAMARISRAIAESEKDSKVYLENTTALPIPITQNMQLLKDANFSKKTADRINYLANLEVGWHANAGQTLNPLSLRNFLNLWLDIRTDANEPDLVLCSNGNIQAEWFKNTKRNLAIEFRAGDAIYVLQDGESYVPAIDDLDNLKRTLTSRNPSPFSWG